MLKNFWYAIEFSSAITTAPKRLRVLGQDLVAFRGEDGAARVLSDLCVHRGGSLSGGWVEGNCVRCPYHGWKFAGDGRCTQIPANTSPVIPKRAVVDAYPTEERYGWLWAFLGDLPEAERPPIPHLPWADDPNWSLVTGEFTWNAHYARVVENGIDIAHTPFVHRNSFGNVDQPQIQDYEIEAGEFEATGSTTLMPPLPKGMWRLIRRKRTPVKATFGFWMPSITRLELDLGKWKTVVIDSNVPVDEHTTRTLFLAYRNFFRGSWANRDVRRRMFKIFREDQATVEAQRPEFLPYDISAELHVKSDGMGVAYRKARVRFLDRGWGIDGDRIEREFKGRRAVVIPSPGRRQGGGDDSQWVMPEVPVAQHKRMKVV